MHGPGRRREIDATGQIAVLLTFAGPLAEAAVMRR